MRSASVASLLESTLLAMLAAGCGGEATSAIAPDAAVASDAAIDLDAGVDAETDPCAAPSRGYSLTSCGDKGDRLTSYACTAVWRQLPCGVTVEAGACDYASLSPEACITYCAAPDSGGPSNAIYCSVATYTGGKSELQCGYECPGGRRPEGYGGERSSDCHPLGRLFARLAQLETVSIGAFGALANELERHGADPTLVARARSARRDEARHARAAWSLARRFGATPRRLARMPRARRRSIAELAEENAAEGCVRETFGAIVTAYQARTSRDPSIAETMRAISIDEAEHAGLAWDLDAFFQPRLDEAGQSRRARALRASITELRREIETMGDAPVAARLAGMPDRGVALFALARLESALTG